jgi:hypothetical protein
MAPWSYFGQPKSCKTRGQDESSHFANSYLCYIIPCRRKLREEKDRLILHGSIRARVTSIWKDMKGVESIVAV